MKSKYVVRGGEMIPEKLHSIITDFCFIRELVLGGQIQITVMENPNGEEIVKFTLRRHIGHFINDVAISSNYLIIGAYLENPNEALEHSYFKCQNRIVSLTEERIKKESEQCTKC